MKKQNEIIIFQASDGAVCVDVRVGEDTVWLTQQQIALLFESSRTNIVEHIDHVYAEGELLNEATCRKFRQVRKEGNREVVRSIPHYNLDMIISVGYRVKSKIATQFRIWATTILKQHLLDGYTVNERRLAQMHKLLQIVARSDDIMIAGVADVLSRYASGLDLLDDYDHQRVSQLKAGDVGEWKLTYNEARAFVDSIQYTERGNLFGNEKDDSFKSALGAIYQTFGGRDVYPSVQEKAANLLYLVVKNHAFSDGNKRIAAALFVFFLDRNHALLGKNGELLIANNTLAAMTLMIALSKPKEKDVICSLVAKMLVP